MSVEYGVRRRWADGRIDDCGPASLAYCRLAVQSQASPKAEWNPRAVAVICRDVGEWRLLEEAAS